MRIGHIAKSLPICFVCGLAFFQEVVVHESAAPEVLGEEFALFRIRIDAEPVRLQNEMATEGGTCARHADLCSRNWIVIRVVHEVPPSHIAIVSTPLAIPTLK